MQRKFLAFGIILILCLNIPVTSQAATENTNQINWWDNYARDKNHDGISDVLIWKLYQEERFFNTGESRVFVRYNHHPTNNDVERLEQAGIEVTFRAQYIDLIATTMPRDKIEEVALWDGVVMFDDIGNFFFTFPINSSIKKRSEFLSPFRIKSLQCFP